MTRKPPQLRLAMTPNPHCIEAEADLSDARRSMREHGIRHLAVMRKGKLIGVLSSRHVEMVEGLFGDRATGVSVDHFCTKPAYVVDVDTPLAEVLATLGERRIGSALVTREGRLAGIFTTTDACKLFAVQLGARLSGDP